MICCIVVLFHEDSRILKLLTFVKMKLVKKFEIIFMVFGLNAFAIYWLSQRKWERGRM